MESIGRVTMKTGKLRFSIFAILIGMFSGSSAVDAANGLFIESGAGVLQSLRTEAVLVRYQREAPPLFKQESFYEGVFMHWNGKNHADALGLAGGIRWAVKDETYFSTALGGCHISRETENLGTPFQFYIRLGAGIRTRRYDVSLALVHISNGKLFFGWEGPNKSENFITLSIGGLF